MNKFNEIVRIEMSPLTMEISAAAATAAAITTSDSENTRTEEEEEKEESKSIENKKKMVIPTETECTYTCIHALCVLYMVGIFVYACLYFHRVYMLRASSTFIRNNSVGMPREQTYSTCE